MKERVVAALGLVLFAVLDVQAADPNPNREMYVRYCGACHGAAGKGDGIAGTFIRPKPSDLTTFGKRTGSFDARKLIAYIDGTSTVGPHGDREMPVWGEILRERGDSDKAAHARIAFIVEYLRSIQER